MLKEEKFIDSIWDKYDSYKKLNNKNKDNFFTQHFYKNTDYFLMIKTFSIFIITILLYAGMVYAGIFTYNFIQKNTFTDFKKNANYDYPQDMIYQNGTYYKIVTNYNDYTICKNRWDNLIEMKQEDFNENFMIIIAGENYSTIGLNIDNISTDDNTTYIYLKKNKETSENTVITAKLSNELYRKNISIQIIPESPNVLQYKKLQDLPKNYSKEEAIKDNCFVIENDKVISNDSNLLNQFIENSKNKINSSIRIAIYFNKTSKIIDIEYKNEQFILCEDNTRNDNGEIYYHTGNKIIIVPNGPLGTFYQLQDALGNNTLICILK